MIHNTAVETGVKEQTRRSRAALHRLLGVQYLVLLMGVAVFLLKAYQIFGLGRELSVRGGVEVFLAAVVVPALVWIVTKEELRLRRNLYERYKEIEQREQETRALNRLMQTHLTECFEKGPADIRR